MLTECTGYLEGLIRQIERLRAGLEPISIGIGPTAATGASLMASRVKRAPDKEGARDPRLHRSSSP